MTYEWTGDSPGPEFDQALADSYVGKYILIGLTYLDARGECIEQVQLHGVIEQAAPDGIRIALRGTRAGDVWTLPPDLSSIWDAPPGEYALKATGEVVVDPDLLSTWTVNKPDVH